MRSAMMRLLVTLAVFVCGTAAFAPGFRYNIELHSYASTSSRISLNGHGKSFGSRTIACSASAVAPGSVVEDLANDEVLEVEELEQAIQPQEVVLVEAEPDMQTKLINASLLLVCFGYALYTILNIDHGMTRGWSQSEIAMRIPLDNWNVYESALSEKPVETKTAINVIIYLLGDWLSQTIFAKKNALDFDAKRTIRNGFIGLCFGPLVATYYEWSDTILPVEAGLWNRIQKILMDQTLYLSVKCSLYIMAVGLLGGDDVKTAQNNVKERIVPIMFTAWKFWPLVHCITYGVIPARHRILWVNSVDLVWNAILASAARGDTPGENEADQGQEELLAREKVGPLPELVTEAAAVAPRERDS